MRALLTPEVAPRLGIVLFRPGSELMHLFQRGRVLVEVEPERFAHFSSGAIPPAPQPIAEDERMKPVFEDERVIIRAGGLSSLEHWLEKQFECQWPHAGYHGPDFTTLKHPPGVIRLCWSCDNQLRDQHTERLAALARKNLVSWLLSVVLRELGFTEEHQLTLPEFCWWLVRNGMADVIPESVASTMLGMRPEEHQSVMRESEIVPMPAATEILQERASPLLKVKVDDESPESFMLKPKRRRWQNEKYTRWVKTQQCSCCNNPADDPHHLIGHGQGGMGTKAHDLFVIPLCRAHHDELHADPVAFEAKHGDQLTLLFRFLDRALATGVLA
ncbi:DUF968 domain-containing protein [Escherichia coli]|nr:DUF968 domain-containing protein [Escherichia coli]HCQ0013146.1 DUF968 domain-containing protein [Escherichia coli]